MSPGDNYVMRARLLTDSKRLPQAIDVLTKGLAGDPQNYDGLCELARAQYQSKTPTPAAETARRAVAVNPQGDWAFRILALASVDRHELDLARANGYRAVEIGPGTPENYSVLVTVLLASGDLASAEKASRKLLELAPERADSHSQAGLVALRQGWRARRQASQHFRKALEIDPSNAVLINNYAVALLRKGKRRQALRLFRSAIATDATNELAFSNLQGMYRYDRAPFPRFVPIHPVVLVPLTTLVLSVGAYRRLFWYGQLPRAARDVVFAQPWRGRTLLIAAAVCVIGSVVAINSLTAGPFRDAGSTFLFFGGAIAAAISTFPLIESLQHHRRESL